MIISRFLDDGSILCTSSYPFTSNLADAPRHPLVTRAMTSWRKSSASTRFCLLNVWRVFTLFLLAIRTSRE